MEGELTPRFPDRFQGCCHGNGPKPGKQADPGQERKIQATGWDPLEKQLQKRSRKMGDWWQEVRGQEKVKVKVSSLMDSPPSTPRCTIRFTGLPGGKLRSESSGGQWAWSVATSKMTTQMWLLLPLQQSLEQPQEDKQGLSAQHLGLNPQQMTEELCTTWLG